MYKIAKIHYKFQNLKHKPNVNQFLYFHALCSNENMKWNTHIKYLSSKLNRSCYMISSLEKVKSPNVLRTIYFACFHVQLRYGLTLWGGDPESFFLQFFVTKKVIRIMGNVGRHASCRNLFKYLNILPLPCLYISEVVCCVKSSMENVKYNDKVHDHFTHQKIRSSYSILQNYPF